MKNQFWSIYSLLLILLITDSNGLLNWNTIRPPSRLDFNHFGNGGDSGGGIGWYGKGGNGFGWNSFNNTTRSSVFGRQIQLQRPNFSLQTWWETHTKGSRGILIWLMPALLSQLMILRTVVPFFMDRLSQYLQPLTIAGLLALTPGKGIRTIQKILLTSAGIGTCFMFRDTYCAGSSWLPLEAKEDSYAIITAAASRNR